MNSTGYTEYVYVHIQIHICTQKIIIKEAVKLKNSGQRLFKKLGERKGKGET